MHRFVGGRIILNASCTRFFIRRIWLGEYWYLYYDTASYSAITVSGRLLKYITCPVSINVQTARFLSHIPYRQFYLHCDSVRITQCIEAALFMLSSFFAVFGICESVSAVCNWALNWRTPKVNIVLMYVWIWSSCRYTKTDALHGRHS